MWLNTDSWHVDMADVCAFRRDEGDVILVLRSGSQVRLSCDTPELATTLIAELAEQVKPT